MHACGSVSVVRVLRLAALQANGARCNASSDFDTLIKFLSYLVPS